MRRVFYWGVLLAMALALWSVSTGDPLPLLFAFSLGAWVVGGFVFAMFRRRRARMQALWLRHVQEVGLAPKVWEGAARK